MDEVSPRTTRTLVVTTQYVGEAEYCDAVAVLTRGRLIALAAPDDLRRMALGGEVLAVDTAQSFDASNLEQVAGVRATRQSAPRHFLVITDEAGAWMAARVIARAPVPVNPASVVALRSAVASLEAIVDSVTA